MRFAALALVLSLAACKDDTSSPPSVKPTTAAPGDAQTQATPDATIGPVLDLVACSPAPMPPADPWPQLGSGRMPGGPRGGGMGALPQGRGGAGTFARVNLGKAKEAGLPGAAEVLRKHQNRLRFCYEQNLLRVPTLKGTSKLSIIVKDSGYPHEVIVLDGIDNELSLCMKHMVMEMKFPVPKKAPVTIEQPLTFEWNPGVHGEPSMPIGWIPYARTHTLVPSEVGVVAAGGLKKAMPTAKVAACLGPQHTGSMRAIIRVGKDGNVFDANVGGFGAHDVELCMQNAIIGTKIDPIAQTAEVACDFVRGDPAPWRVDPAAYEWISVTGSTGRGDAGPGDGGVDINIPAATFLVTLEPAATATDVRDRLAQASRGAAYVVAIQDDANKPPLFLLAGRGYGSIPDPASPLTLDAREPLRICNGLLDAPASAPFVEAEKVLASAARRCTKKPCPTPLTITLPSDKTADALATLVAAARRAGFERIRLGQGACPPVRTAIHPR